MSTSTYLLGAVELAVIAAALGLGAYHLRALLVPAWIGALARLAEVVIAAHVLILVSELLGVLGLFKEVPLLIGYVAVGLGVTFLVRRRGTAAEAPRTSEARSSGVMVAIGIAAAALVVVHWAHPTSQAIDQGMYYQDTTWYHMSFSARFAQTGNVGPLHFTDPLKLAAWFYPQNSELLHGIGIVFLKTDFLSPLINLVWVALCLLAAWCVGPPVRDRRRHRARRGGGARLEDDGRLPGGPGAERRRGALLPDGRDRLPGRRGRERSRAAMRRRPRRTPPAMRTPPAGRSSDRDGATRRSWSPGWSRTCRWRATPAPSPRSAPGRCSWPGSRRGWGSARRSRCWPRSAP